MPYSTPELSEYNGQPLFLYRFETPKPLSDGGLYTNMPVTVTAEIDGIEYDFIAPEGGISHTEPEQDEDAQHGDIDVTVSKDHPVVKAHRSFPPPGDTTLTIYRKHRNDPEVKFYWSGIVTRTTIRIMEDGTVEGHIECQTELSFYEAEGLVDTFMNPCNFFLGDGRCPVNLANWRRTLTVVSVNDNVVVVTGDILIADGKYRGGRIVCADNDQRTILDDVLDLDTDERTFTLTQGLPSTTIQANDVIDGYRGCDLKHSTCSVDFGDETGEGNAFGGNPAQASINPHELGRLP